MKKNENNVLLNNISSIGLILRPDSPELKNTFMEIKQIFNKHNIGVFLEYKSANMIQEKGMSLEKLCNKVDFLLSVGGDGTLLSTVRRSFNYSIPIMGVNLGNLGFLTNLNMSSLEDFVKNLKENKYNIDKRMMLEGSLNDKKFYAFNEIVITRKSVSSMTKIRANINNKAFNIYSGDGVIISTPTGSTAYNLSVGGPIMYPLTKAFIITPVASHSLTQRPIVMPSEVEIEFSIITDEDGVVIVDGQESYEAKKGEVIKIKVADKKVKMLHTLKRNYFEVLNEKLRWGSL